MKFYYEEILGCEVESLKLVSEKNSYSNYEELVLKSDILYVGGGNTKKMLETWMKLGIDKLLEKAYEKGILLSGLSAGAICWFNEGYSDSDTISAGEKKTYSIVKALGFIPLIYCPHYFEEDRELNFDRMILEHNKLGLAATDNCAIDIKNDQFRIVKSKDDAKAFKIYKKDNELIKKELNNSEYLNIDFLYKK